MNKKRISFLSVGLPSMCTIFAVLCLVILALLTLGTSSQDLQTARLTLDQSTAYYTACSAATVKYQEALTYTREMLADIQDEAAYNTEMAAITTQYPDIFWDQTEQLLSFTVDFADDQALYVEISIPYPSEASALSPEILTWETISTVEWNPDTKQPVYKGDN